MTSTRWRNGSRATHTAAVSLDETKDVKNVAMIDTMNDVDARETEAELRRRACRLTTIALSAEFSLQGHGIGKMIFAFVIVTLLLDFLLDFLPFYLSLLTWILRLVIGRMVLFLDHYCRIDVSSFDTNTTSRIWLNSMVIAKER